MIDHLTGTQFPPQDTHEQRLIARFQQGDPEALATLYDRYVDRVFACAYHLLNNREDAEEVTIEAFLRAFERAATFRGECPLLGWLLVITRNLCRDRQRQPRLLTLEPEVADRHAVRASALCSTETALAVQRALEALPEEYRLVLMLCDVQEWDAREAATILHRSVQATKSLLYRARRALRQQLQDTWNREDATDAM
ncbi:MAG: sigma-70 family RNA polymerase sigma factor [Chloroherpetonaceae bacterium]|nr:sigma-70 family RNA polymerase sigma factor [Chloroherpetonaceae bacterium]